MLRKAILAHKNLEINDVGKTQSNKKSMLPVYFQFFRRTLSKVRNIGSSSFFFSRRIIACRTMEGSGVDSDALIQFGRVAVLAFIISKSAALPSVGEM